MQHISEAVPKALVMSAQPMKVDPRNTKAWGKLEAFKTFGDPQLERMKAEAASFIDDLTAGRAPRWLSFLGTSGSGKTMLAKIISRESGGTFRKWTSIARWVREGDHRLFYDLCNDRDCVVMDDIGSEYGTDYVKSKLYELLSERENKPTIITANLSLAQIGQSFDTRIASRMIRHGSTVVDVDVPDFNLRATQAA